MTIDIGTDRPGHSLRLLVFQALERYPTTSLFPLLLDRDPIVRTAVARCLQMRPEIELTYAEVKNLTVHRKSQAREIAAFVLGQLGTPNMPLRYECIPILERLCKDRSPEVRISALAALGHLNSTESDAIVKSAQQDANPDVQEMAHYVEAKLKDTSKNSPPEDLLI